MVPSSDGPLSAGAWLEQDAILGSAVSDEGGVETPAPGLTLTVIPSAPARDLSHHRVDGEAANAAGTWQSAFGVGAGRTGTGREDDADRFDPVQPWQNPSRQVRHSCMGPMGACPSKSCCIQRTSMPGVARLVLLCGSPLIASQVSFFWLVHCARAGVSLPPIAGASSRVRGSARSLNHFSRLVCLPLSAWRLRCSHR